MARAADIGTAFTYQGQLKQNGAPANGNLDMEFRLFDAATLGNQIGNPVTLNGVAVSNGLFTVTLNAAGEFGPRAFNGEQRWLQITVDGTTLTPRQELKPAPHALALPGLYTQQNATSPNVIGGYRGNSVTAGVVGATISGGGDASSPNTVTGGYGTVGGGQGNTASGRFVRGECLCGGVCFDDFDCAGSCGAVPNRCLPGPTYATVCGGGFNTASGYGSAVGAGSSNTASGYISTVGGGASNTASASHSTVGGGQSNTASGSISTVGGGFSNTASGTASTVPGGFLNEASGPFGFAAGQRAKANHTGTFVWADYSPFADFASTGPNQFLVRASGGTEIYSNMNATIGVQLAAGGNSWSAISDRSVKENVTPVDSRDVLERLAAIPIGEWNLISQDPSIRHIGPMAQDFHAAFRVGEMETHISSSDADGVALAAIQGLYEVVQDKDCELSEMQERESIKDQRINELEARLARLEALWKTREHLNVASPLVGDGESLDGTQKGEKP